MTIGSLISPVGIDHGDQSLFSNKFMIHLRIKGRIKCESRPRKIHANLFTKGDYIAEGFGQNRCIMCVDGFGSYRSYDEPVIIGDRQLFFAFLMFVS